MVLLLEYDWIDVLNLWFKNKIYIIGWLNYKELFVYLNKNLCLC